jgi:WD40 repeat protein
VCSITVSHDNRRLASGSRDQSVRFWDLRTGEVQLILHGHIHSGQSWRACTRATHSSLFIVCMHALVVLSVDLSPSREVLATRGDGPVKICACLAPPHKFIQDTRVDADGSSRRELHDASEGAGKHTNMSNNSVCLGVTASLAFAWPFLYLSFPDGSYKLLSA